MTKPRRDSRSMLERARELAKLSGYAAHERSGELADALRAMMPVVEAAVAAGTDSRKLYDLAAACSAIRAPHQTVDGWPRR